MRTQGHKSPGKAISLRFSAGLMKKKGSMGDMSTIREGNGEGESRASSRYGISMILKSCWLTCNLVFGLTKHHTQNFSIGSHMAGISLLISQKSSNEHVLCAIASFKTDAICYNIFLRASKLETDSTLAYTATREKKLVVIT